MSPKPARKRRKVVREENGFQHAALDKSRPCIRLVRFLQRRPDRTLTLELRDNVQLDHECPQFIALSYEWGSPTPTRTVIINGKSFAVRDNLHLFLDTLNRQHKGRNLGFFWADAICIDQTNVRERNHQVQQMAQIYRQASKVLAWVGLSHGCYDWKLVQLLRVGYQKQQQMQSVADDPYGEDSDHIAYESWPSLWHNAQMHESLKDLTERSYWGRLWIVQELMLAREIQIVWGCHTIDLNIIVGCITSWVWAPGGVTRLFADLECEMIAWYFEQQKERGRHSLTMAISYFGDFGCSLLHDKVYGLLGLADDHSEMGVDYDISIESLFFDVVKASSSQAHLEYLFALAETLHLSFDMREDEVHILHRRDQGAAASESVLVKYPSRDICNVDQPWSSVLPRELGGEDKTAFTWEWFGFRAGEEWLRFYVNHMSASQARCHCALCCVDDWTPRDIPSEPDDFFEKYEWLDPKLPGNIARDKRHTPWFWLLFSDNQYFATVVFCKNEGSPTANACVLFRDPFHVYWSVKDEIGRTQLGTYGPSKRIVMPLISVFITIAHGLRKKAELEDFFDDSTDGEGQYMPAPHHGMLHEHDEEGHSPHISSVEDCY